MVLEKEISVLLKEAFDEDQKVISEKDENHAKEIFKKNTDLLKQIIKERGWPSLENDSSAFSHAWLIAQHSDHDPIFQIQCLGFIIANLKENKERLIDCAFLIDRILVNFKREQVFGTQFNAKLEIPNVISQIQIESLRLKVGLEPIKEYIKRMKNFIKGHNL